MDALPEATKDKIEKINASKDPMDHTYETKREAMKKAKEMGLTGIHEHKTDDGMVLYMPGSSHKEFLEKHEEILKEKSAKAKVDLSKYSFSNPGQAMQAAKKLGFDKVHTHKVGDKTVFMPGPSHEALMKKLKS